MRLKTMLVFLALLPMGPSIAAAEGTCSEPELLKAEHAATLSGDNASLMNVLTFARDCYEAQAKQTFDREAFLERVGALIARYSELNKKKVEDNARYKFELLNKLNHRRAAAASARLGEIAKRTNDTNSAIAHYTRALEWDPDNASFRDQLAKLRANAKN